MVEHHFQTTGTLDEEQSIDFDAAVKSIKQEIIEQANPLLMSLVSAAEFNKAPYLWDDDAFSLGFGPTSQTWPIDQLPKVADIQWSKYHKVPVVYVTGTNGKSTSVRILSHIFKQAGKNCGVTSTDFIRVGDRIIDTGDYSGPGGARMLLRENQVEVAVLEVARGGLLRRGLPIPTVDGAIITNIAEDHLGQYGINDIAALTRTKFMVAKGLQAGSPLVLNADDAEIVRYQKTNADQLTDNVCWFSLDQQHPLLEGHRQLAKTMCFSKNGYLYFEYSNAEEETVVEEIVEIAKIPMTLQGAAKHNVQNALGAIGLAKSLGVSNQAIASALEEFKSDGQDNPGRGNFYRLKGATVIVDFAHNVHSMQAMADTLNALPANKKWLMLGHAGDRSDAEITDLTQCIMQINPDYLMITENVEYLRGRVLEEIPALISNAAIKAGMSPAQIQYCDTPSNGAQAIVNGIGTDDLVFLMVLSERGEVVNILETAAD
jgi:UDP-N-acetylmuramyl tripeptide synthase